MSLGCTTHTRCLLYVSCVTRAAALVKAGFGTHSFIDSYSSLD